MDFVFSKDIRLNSSCVKYYQNRTVTGCMLSWQGSWVVSSVGCYLVSRSCSLQCIQSADRVKCSSVVRPCVATTDRVHTEVSSIVCRISRLDYLVRQTAWVSQPPGQATSLRCLCWTGDQVSSVSRALCIRAVSKHSRSFKVPGEGPYDSRLWSLWTSVPMQCHANLLCLHPRLAKILLKVL